MEKKVFDLLVIEDDSADVDLIKEALSLSPSRPFELRLHVVENGEDAMRYLNRVDEYANENLPDLIVLDLNMPRKGGHDVLREIKDDARLKSIPVIILTTSSSLEDIRKSYALGANSFITKARDFSEFSRIIHTIEGYWFNTAALPHA